MFSEGGWQMLVGVFLSLALVVGSIWYVSKLFANYTQEILVRFILIVFIALVAVWVADKLIAFKINLLSESEGKELFDLIKTLVLMIFSYYFGTKKATEK
jgi:hypothetical protein